MLGVKDGLITGRTLGLKDGGVGCWEGVRVGTDGRIETGGVKSGSQMDPDDIQFDIAYKPY